jgi:hypothetical protein
LLFGIGHFLTQLACWLFQLFAVWAHEGKSPLTPAVSG